MSRSHMVRSVAVLCALLLAVPGDAIAAGKPKPAAHGKKKAAPAAKGGKPSKPAARGKATKPGAAPRARNEAVRGETDGERRLQDDLDGLLASKTFAGTHTGVYVVDVATGRVLYSAAADEALNPASNMKLLSTATALDALGADFRYATRLVGPAPDADGVVHGDVYLVGMGDPTLTDAGLAGLAADARAHGITAIEGGVIASRDPERDALARSRLAINVRARGGDGDLADVTVSPDSAYVVLENEATVSRGAKVATPCKRVKRRVKGKLVRQRVCGAARPAGVGVSLRSGDSPSGPELVVRVTGKLRPGSQTTLWREAPSGGALAAHSVRAHLKRAGITVRGGVTLVDLDDKPPEGAMVLGEHQSIALTELVAMINKPSSNFLADRLIRAVGLLRFGAATFNAGARAMREYLARIGVHDDFVLENGSGLSYSNRMTAKQVVQVLLAGNGDTRIASAFFDSLAVGGKDGTLRGRFGGAARGHVFAKTGTLTGVSALSGFVTQGGRTLCFAILNNGFRPGRKQSIRAGQGQLVEAMFRYVRRVDAAAPGFVPAPGVTLPANPMPEPEPEPDAVPVDGVDGEPSDAVDGEPTDSEPADGEPGEAGDEGVPGSGSD